MGTTMEQFDNEPMGTTMEQFGDNHKVKLSRKRSKTNGVKLGEMASG